MTEQSELAPVASRLAPPRRVITVGGRQVTGVLCPSCFAPTVIFPESVLGPHLERHAAQRAVARQYYNKGAGGRTRGARNTQSMSSTGVEKSAVIRNPRGRRG